MENPKINRLLIITLCVAYVALRLWRLTDSCLWFDEIFGVHAAEQPWGEMFWFVAQDVIHPPLFYVFLKLWISTGGEGLLWLRLLPVLFSVVALIPFIYLCRELSLKTPATVFALLFFAVNGSLIKYSQEVRMYSLVLCLSLFSVWLFARFFFRGKNIWILTIINVLLVYTHYFGWLVIVGEIVVILFLQRIKVRHVLIMLGISVVAFVPWVVTVIRTANLDSDVQQNIGWITKPDFRSIFDFVFDLIEPFYFQQSSADDSTKLLITLPLLAIIVAAKLIYLADWKRHDERNKFWLLSIISAVPLLLSFALSWILPVSIWGSRHLIIVFAPMMILAAIFITEIAIQPIKYVLASSILLLTATAFVLQVRSEQPKFIWCAWEDVAQNLPSSQPQTVYAFEDLVAYQLWFTVRKNGNVRIVKVDGVPEMTEDKAYFLPRGFEGVDRTVPDSITGNRFWVAFRDLKWDERHPPISFLIPQGYKIGKPFTIEAQSQRAFLVEVGR